MQGHFVSNNDSNIFNSTHTKGKCHRVWKVKQKRKSKVTMEGLNQHVQLPRWKVGSCRGKWAKKKYLFKLHIECTQTGVTVRPLLRNSQQWTKEFLQCIISHKRKWLSVFYLIKMNICSQVSQKKYNHSNHCNTLQNACFRPAQFPFLSWKEMTTQNFIEAPFSLPVIQEIYQG